LCAYEVSCPCIFGYDSINVLQIAVMGYSKFGELFTEEEGFDYA